MAGNSRSGKEGETAPTEAIAEARTLSASQRPDTAPTVDAGSAPPSGGDPATEPTAGGGDPATEPTAGGAASGFEAGALLDRFVVLDKLGEGGMGVVLAAFDPDLDRKVAIKLLRPKQMGDRDADRSQMRLLREAQAMARLSHPNVVVVHDVGTVGDRVFVAMEHVDGCTLRDWVDEKARPAAEVIAMFLRAGRGLAAAHAAGLIHRDFKPENVLVGHDGRVRVSDFGLAATSGAVAEETAEATANEAGSLSSKTPLSASLTRTGALLGTPLYMPPEQHKRQKIDARGDQFSFCVALYEALYGERPFPGDSYPELASNVIDGKVRPPSKAADVPAWVRRVLLQGLKSDPGERFPSMDALIAALAHDPVAARRRRFTAGAIAAAFVLLCALAVYGAFRERRASGVSCERASEDLGEVWTDETKPAAESAFLATGRPYAADTFRRVETTLDDYAKSWMAMRREACEATHVRGTQSQQLLDLRMHCLDRRLAEMSALVRLFTGGMNARALDRAVSAVRGLPELSRCADTEALTAAFPLPDDPDTRARIDGLEKQLDVARARNRVGEYRAAIEPAEAVAAEAKTLGYPPLLASALGELGRLQHKAGEPKTAEATLVEAAKAANQARDHRQLAAAWVNLVWVVGYELGKPDEARGHVSAAEVALVRIPGDRDLRAELHNGLGAIAYRRGDFAKARDHHQRARALREAALGSNHHRVAESLNNLGLVFYELAEYDEALKSYQRALAIIEEALGPSHPYIGVFLANLANVYFDKGELAKAREHHERALELKERTLGRDHPRVGVSLTNIGSVLYLDEKPAEARKYEERALAIFESQLDSDHPFLAYPLTGLGQCDLAQGRPALALPRLERALRIREAKGSSAHDVARTRFHLARALWATGGDRKRALSLAQTARAAFADPESKPQPDLEEIDDWLRKVGASR